MMCWVEKSLQSKTSGTNFSPTTRRFRRLQALSKCINEIYSTDLVKYLLAAEGIFNDFIEFRQKKLSQRKFASIQKKMISWKITPKKLWVDKWTEFGRAFRKICTDKNMEVSLTWSETKAAFVVRAIQSLRHVIYRFIEDHYEKLATKFQ